MFQYNREETKYLYQTMVDWWEDWEFPILPESSLPKTCFVVYKEGLPLYIIPVYTTDSDFCWVGFPVGNKRAPMEWKKGALDFLMEHLEKEMKSQGFSKIITTSGTPKLMELFERRGFIVGDTQINNYIKHL